MRVSVTALVALLVTSVSAAADQSDIDFFTALVGDYQAHKTDYVKYFATAQGVPAVLSTIATQVLTYTDDSYTTLLDNPSLSIAELESYATNIPWYTRIEAAGAANGGSSGAASDSHSASSATGSSATRNTAASTSTSTSTSTANGGSARMAAPIGAALGALAIALL
ncbi:TIR3 [Candida oxycetoniae]|uniref:TIR3 n=1 Tax=Candida oxycetoniae TaxID=497107 RepID=A0AAI9SXF6_9ASCO|nr:TIR3 [Candida oxycetoniae]KAI3404580.1 TIR3 [Candida oxycetoniae]